MLRPIRGYHEDDQGDWVAELSCGHGQHVRHQPPFRLRKWVMDARGRESRLATPLDCPLCDQAEQPDGLVLVGSTPHWDQRSMPDGLRQWHSLAEGTWGQLVVRFGTLRFVAQTRPGLDVILSSGTTQAIPPDVLHLVDLMGPVRFSIDLLVLSDRRAGHDLSSPEGYESGGDAACWAHLVCGDCGALLDGGSHGEGCRSNP